MVPSRWFRVGIVTLLLGACLACASVTAASPSREATRGIAGDEYSVSTRTHPVWLGKRGWAYIDPDDNAGWTISVVRAVGHIRWPPTYLPEYTYKVLGACQEAGTSQAHMVACLKRVAVS